VRTHELKTDPGPFQRVWDYAKKAELRVDDRGFQQGDELHLMEWDGKNYTGRSLEVLVTDIIRNKPEWGLHRDYVIMSIMVLKKRGGQ
jgi:hypothetical protein